MAPAKQVAKRRIKELFALANEHVESDPALARNAIGKLRKLATKHLITITEYKRQFCLECSTPLTPATATTRIRDGRRVITCKHCGAVKRLGLPDAD